MLVRVCVCRSMHRYTSLYLFGETFSFRDGLIQRPFNGFIPESVKLATRTGAIKIDDI